MQGWQVEEKPQPAHAAKAVEWFGHELNETLATIDQQYADYRLSEALMSVYKLFWDEFSSWYLEMVKPDYQAGIDAATYKATIGYFDTLLHILHPFMPFITEEIWNYIDERTDGESLMVDEMPVAGSYDTQLLEEMELAKEVIAFIRNTRQQKQLPNKEQLMLQVKPTAGNNAFIDVVQRLGNLSEIQLVDEKSGNAITLITKQAEYYVVMEGLVNAEEELKKLQDELVYTKGFLTSVMKKLSNERFVNNAPENVVAVEKQKQADAEAKIKALEEQIATLK